MKASKFAEKLGENKHLLTYLINVLDVFYDSFHAQIGMLNRDFECCVCVPWHYVIIDFSTVEC